MQANIENMREIFLALISQITEYKLNETMAKHTSFLCGGEAAIYVACEDPITTAKILYIAKLFGVPCTVLGNGSNVLFSDRGFNGLVLQLKKNSLKAEGDTLYAFAGTRLSYLSKEAKHLSLTGLEFAHGIPGSVGGAVYMNAGCYGNNISDVLIYADCLNLNNINKANNIANAKEQSEAIIKNKKELPILRYSNEELKFSYRNSLVKEQNLLVLNAAFKLKPGEQDKIANTMQEMQEKRHASQPLEYPSAGSFFKRPHNNFAGALIEQSGLKGLRIGGAQVSEKHAGFIINTGGATSSDVWHVAQEVQNKVYQKFQVMLEPEVEFIGFE
ncbi:MAG: UDP-N-acetylmuramate dehydrogenase [Eubacteriales bacterium]|nr:UDP-N-acetylmuramate dehydrogenase [Eubacteriales bacterium]